MIILDKLFPTTILYTSGYADNILDVDGVFVERRRILGVLW